jgi:predicted thioesterase
VTQKSKKLVLGLSCRVEKVVPFDWTIAHYNAKLPPVLSTPAMIGMMEVAAARAIQSALPKGAISVGTRIEVDHLKAVPAGATVSASARLTAMNGRFLEFEVEASSGADVIGRGKVFRAVVEPRKFHARAKTRGHK